jgi:seryl-tRNA synthetase
MLDARLIRENRKLVLDSLINRNRDTSILDRFDEIDRRWKRAVDRRNTINRARNESAIKISKLAGSERDREIDEAKRIAAELKQVSDEIQTLEKEREELLLYFPNIPSRNTPVGKSEEDNVVLVTPVGPRAFKFRPLPHYELCERLGMLDMKSGAKITGSGFYVLKGEGARLERALINYMMDMHRRQGYTEVQVPVIVRSKCALGTGTLPEKKDDMYWVEGEDLLLNPTAEVPVTNLLSEEILSKEDLPVYYAAFLRSFRKEAGKHVDLKGIGRVHEFNKVELVKFVEPENRMEELQKLLKDAEEVVRGLKLPYRLKHLCTGDLGFSNEETFDIEIYAPGIDNWLEVSSCSSFGDFQARRAHIKYRKAPHLKSEFVATLNGSGLALPRTFIGVVENYQLEDGGIEIPDVLRPYMGNEKVISPK